MSQNNEVFIEHAGILNYLFSWKVNVDVIMQFHIHGLMDVVSAAQNIKINDKTGEEAFKLAGYGDFYHQLPTAARQLSKAQILAYIKDDNGPQLKKAFFDGFGFEKGKVEYFVTALKLRKFVALDELSRVMDPNFKIYISKPQLVDGIRKQNYTTFAHFVRPLIKYQQLEGYRRSRNPFKNEGDFNFRLGWERIKEEYDFFLSTEDLNRVEYSFYLTQSEYEKASEILVANGLIVLAKDSHNKTVLDYYNYDLNRANGRSKRAHRELEKEKDHYARNENRRREERRATWRAIISGMADGVREVTERERNYQRQQNANSFDQPSAYYLRDSDSSRSIANNENKESTKLSNELKSLRPDRQYKRVVQNQSGAKNQDLAETSNSEIRNSKDSNRDAPPDFQYGYISCVVYHNSGDTSLKRHVLIPVKALDGELLSTLNVNANRLSRDDFDRGVGMRCSGETLRYEDDKPEALNERLSSLAETIERHTPVKTLAMATSASLSNLSRTIVAFDNSLSQALNEFERKNNMPKYVSLSNLFFDANNAGQYERSEEKAREAFDRFWDPNAFQKACSEKYPQSYGQDYVNYTNTTTYTTGDWENLSGENGKYWRVKGVISGFCRINPSSPVYNDIAWCEASYNLQTGCALQQPEE